jgi:hypothetical protein
MYPTKAMTPASDDDEPAAYMNDLPIRYSRTRARDANWRNPPTVRSGYSPPPSRGRDITPNFETTTEVPLRPNRRDDVELGMGGLSPRSQAFMPISAANRPTRTKSTSGNSRKNWLKNIKSPIGEPQAYLLVLGPLVC